jgi:hypothetical protein
VDRQAKKSCKVLIKLAISGHERKSMSSEKTPESAPSASRCYAIVSMFGRRKLCKVTACGEKQKEYSKDQILWVERGEDEYARPHYKAPFCVLYRKDWLRGEESA